MALSWRLFFQKLLLEMLRKTQVMLGLAVVLVTRQFFV